MFLRADRATTPVSVVTHTVRPVCWRKGGGDVADHAAVLMRHEEGRSITRNSADNVRSL